MTLPSETALNAWLPLFFVLIGGSFVAQIAWAIWQRKKAGLSLSPSPAVDAVFVERRTSGRSLATLLTKIGGASNCLLVFVTPRDIHVALEFPFGIMMPKAPYGLEFTRPLANIVSVQRESGFLRGDVVVVRWSDNAAFEFRLKNSDAFIGALPKR